MRVKNTIPNTITDKERRDAASVALLSDQLANAKNRANHSGVQPSTTIADFTEAVQDVVAQFFGGQVTYSDETNSIIINFPEEGSTTDLEAVRDAIGVALIPLGLMQIAVNDAGDTISISTTATQNSTDAALRDRTTHTGVQPANTIEQDPNNRFVSDTEKEGWNSKLAGDRTIKINGVAKNLSENPEFTVTATADDPAKTIYIPLTGLSGQEGTTILSGAGAGVQQASAPALIPFGMELSTGTTATGYAGKTNRPIGSGSNLRGMVPGNLFSKLDLQLNVSMPILSDETEKFVYSQGFEGVISNQNLSPFGVVAVIENNGLLSFIKRTGSNNTYHATTATIAANAIPKILVTFNPQTGIAELWLNGSLLAQHTGISVGNTPLQPVARVSKFVGLTNRTVQIGMGYIKQVLV